jgi:type VI secretion system secreted protein Hcp
MAIDSYMYFQTYDDKYLESESQVSFSKGPKDLDICDPFVTAYKSKLDANKRRSGLFEVEDYSFDIEQALNIGSQSSGAGAGKVVFNPFSITRKIDCSSATFFGMACSGTPFKEVGLGMRKSAGGTVTGTMFLSFTFKLVAVKTVSWAHDDESPKETVTFEYGGLLVSYLQQKPDGSLDPVPSKGWNRVKNIAADDYKSPSLAIT